MRIASTMLIALGAAALLSACSTGKSGGAGGWSGPEPLTSQMRQQCLDIWAAEIERRSPDGPQPSSLANFERLRVVVSTGVPRLPEADQLAVVSGGLNGSVYQIMFRDAVPAERLWRHESAHPYLIRHGEPGHPKQFGRRHGLWNWR